jgi:hypothetical protein
VDWVQKHLFLQKEKVLFLFKIGVKNLPKILYDSKTIVCQNWKQEPNTFSTKTVLQNINEMLVSSPVIVQILQPLNSKSVESIKIPFPFNKKMELKKEDEDEILKILKIIIKNLYLEYSFGTIEFQKTTYIDNSIEYLPIKISFGLPLEDENLNKIVLNGNI